MMATLTAGAGAGAGAGSAVIYIDTEGAFSAERLAQMVRTWCTPNESTVAADSDGVDNVGGGCGRTTAIGMHALLFTQPNDLSFSPSLPLSLSRAHGNSLSLTPATC